MGPDWDNSKGDDMREYWRRKAVVARAHRGMTTEALVALVHHNFPLSDPDRGMEVTSALDELRWRHVDQNPSPDEWAEVLGLRVRHPDCEGLAQFNGMFERQIAGVLDMLDCMYNPSVAPPDIAVIIDRENSGFWYPAACDRVSG